MFSYEAMATPHANVVGQVSAAEGGMERIEGLLRACHDEAHAMLNDHRHIVEALRDALLEHDELIGDEIARTIELAVAPNQLRIFG